MGLLALKTYLLARLTKKHKIFLGLSNSWERRLLYLKSQKCKIIIFIKQLVIGSFFLPYYSILLLTTVHLLSVEGIL